MTKHSKIDIDSEKLKLAKNPNPNHETVEQWYGNYGAHTSTESHGDLMVQAVDPDWLGEGLDDDEIADKLRESSPDLTDDEIEGMIDLARRVWGYSQGVVADLEKAVEAHQADDLDGVLEALRDARSQETDHGDDPATSNLARQLLEEAPDAE